MHSLTKLLFIPTLLIGLTACSIIQRSSGSGYGYYDADLDDPYRQRRERLRHEKDVTKREMGLDAYGSLNEDQQEALETRLKLRRLERTLTSKMERDQYYKYKPLLNNDRERIALLRIGSYEGRQRWLSARGIDTNNIKHPPEIQELIEQNDISLGMTKQAVRESWGDPAIVEVAGNPIYGNERWKYTEYITSSEGYQAENRVIYFESGRVVGWDTH